MMKKMKFVSLLMAILLLLLMTSACDTVEKLKEISSVSSPPESTPFESTEPVTKEKTEKGKDKEVEEAPAQIMSAEFETFNITIAGAELTEREGEPMLRVLYDCTNVSDQILCALFGRETQRTATQNGEELESNIIRLDDVEEYTYYNAYNMPGVIVRAAENFELLDTSSPVTLELADGNRSGVSLTVTFDLNNLPAPGPAPELILVPEIDIEKMTGYIGTESDFSSTYKSDKFHLKITDSEVVERDGKKIARIVLEFTPLAAEEGGVLVPTTSLGYMFFQDGLLLERSYSVPKLEATVPGGTKVAIGETVQLEVTRLLRTDSPVIACVANYMVAPARGEPFLGVVVE